MLWTWTLAAVYKTLQVRNESYKSIVLLSSNYLFTESTPDSVNEEIPNEKQLSIKFHQLDLLTNNEKTVKIINTIAHKWEKLAFRLYFCDSDIARIKRDNTKDCIQACRTVFSEWLHGNGRRPGTWETLIEALKEAEFSVLADDIETIVFT